MSSVCYESQILLLISFSPPHLKYRNMFSFAFDWLFEFGCQKDARLLYEGLVLRLNPNGSSRARLNRKLCLDAYQNHALWYTTISTKMIVINIIIREVSFPRTSSKHHSQHPFDIPLRTPWHFLRPPKDLPYSHSRDLTKCDGQINSSSSSPKRIKSGAGWLLVYHYGTNFTRIPNTKWDVPNLRTGTNKAINKLNKRQTTD